MYQTHGLTVSEGAGVVGKCDGSEILKPYLATNWS